MRAAVVSRLAGPSAIAVVDVPDVDVPDAPEATDRVVLDVAASGVCFPDLLMTYGKYQVRPDPPFVPGAEVAGTVVSAPESTGLTPGSRVLAFASLGGYAERVAVDPGAVAAIPDSLGFAEAASLVINYQTVEFALSRRARLAEGETVVVLGAAGGVGTAAIGVAKAHGARVVAVVRREGHDDLLRELGADEVVRLGDGWGERVRELGGADVVLDPVGGDVFDEAVRVLRPDGRLVVIGFAAGGIPEIKVNRVLFRNISIVGAAWGEYLRTHPGEFGRIHDDLLGLVAGGLEPVVTARYGLPDAARALADLESGAIVGKGVLLRE
ncbi:NADPH:quinone oxidoreductase family protein [Rhodococcus rhodnii]|uniref:NADPH:quinone reductase n=2 Tax=Rhodococcus rhodnii TaxID=38312 RepID=R7WJR1_9NOCA|nr:NADPH:quinone oxidoreductase family protein [Rhodococcus rhodnii]EOM75556.1 NADPH:quinone reductase [Rhodococcus rhodnii LMG 5362]TXG91911.1 NADPH:quinone oxidoreductase family protein [Rhodococcus rhodnii]